MNKKNKRITLECSCQIEREIRMRKNKPKKTSLLTARHQLLLLSISVILLTGISVKGYAADSNAPDTTKIFKLPFNSKEGDWFGISVSLSQNGTIALVGAPGSYTTPGDAYIFTKESGQWIMSAKLTGADSPETYDFGNAVCLSSDGQTALIGSGEKDGTGSAYIFHVDAADKWKSTSAYTARLTSFDTIQFDGFGIAVSLSSDGTTALVGAHSTGTKKADNSGKAYIYHVPSANLWKTTNSYSAKLNASVSNDYDCFGSSLCLSADGCTALIGAGGKNDSKGAAYIYTVSAADQWKTTAAYNAELTLPDGNYYEQFGYAVSLSSDGRTALIGTQNSDGPGAAYIYTVSSIADWKTGSFYKVKFTNDKSTDEDDFGTAVCLSSDSKTALIGARNENTVGTAYRYHITAGNSWDVANFSTQKLAKTDGEFYDRFGAAVSLSSDGTTAFIGAYGEQEYTGAVYWYSLTE